MRTRRWDTEQDRDHNRDVAAAHEIGHLIGLRLAGARIRQVRIWGQHATVQGVTSFDLDPVADPDQARAHLVALLAGAEAGDMWCDEHRLHRPGAQASGTDLDLYRRLRQNPLYRAIPLRHVEQGARRLVADHWPTITRLAEPLSRDGYLHPDHH